MHTNQTDESAFGRREALGLLGALALFAPGAAHAQNQVQTQAQTQAQTPAQAKLGKTAFLDASGLVTGVKPAELTGLTDALLSVFQAQGAVIGQLAALARATPPADLAAAIAGTPMEPVAKALAAAWYTATVGAGASAKLLSYEDALAWKVAGFDATPGLCAGEFGFWADAPSSL